MKKKIKIGFAGLSHLGINYAVATAFRGFQVICFDENLKIIESLKNMKLPFYEKNLKKNLKKNYKKFKFTNNIRELSKCDLVFISKDTPTNSLNTSNTISIKKLIRKVTNNITKKSSLIILSQVPPGFTRRVNWN